MVCHRFSDGVQVVKCVLEFYRVCAVFIINDFHSEYKNNTRREAKQMHAKEFSKQVNTEGKPTATVFQFLGA